MDELVTARDRYALQMVFSRGFSTGWLDGKMCIRDRDITHVTVVTFFCKAIQQASHSDIAIYNCGGVRARSHLCKGPVSYTHLDVYKRQAAGRRRKRWSAR